MPFPPMLARSTRPLHPSRVWAKVSGWRVCLPQPHSPHKRLICLSSLSVHTLCIAQTPCYSFRAARPSAQPGACDPHTSTRALRHVRGQPWTHTSTHTAAELCPKGCSPGVLTHTHNTHSHMCTRRHTCVPTPAHHTSHRCTHTRTTDVSICTHLLMHRNTHNQGPPGT